MAMPWKLAVHVAELVWIVLQGWMSSCLLVAEEIALALYNGEIRPFHVG
ncbi:uncharacterized protein LOC144706957 [Wolffia australiana]